jgi:hypothetical protein
MKIETVRSTDDSTFKTEVQKLLDDNFEIKECGALTIDRCRSSEWWAILTKKEPKDLPPGDFD